MFHLRIGKRIDNLDQDSCNPIFNLFKAKTKAALVEAVFSFMAFGDKASSSTSE